MEELYLFLNTERYGYTPKQCGNGSLTVGELIEILQDYDEDTKVLFRNDNGYTYGCIYEESIQLDKE